MKCLLLCAGYGTRLYPLTREKPKALLPVGGVAIISRIMDKILPVKEIDKVYLVSNHRFVQHFYHWWLNFKEAMSPKVSVEIFDDLTTDNESRLGAIGDIEFVLNGSKLDDDLIVIAGDNLLTFEMADFAKFGKSKRLAIAVKDLKNKELASMYGVVRLDGKSRIVEFEEKPPSPAASTISIGIYFFGREKLPLIRHYIAEGHSKDAPGYYLQWLHKKEELFGYVIKGQWFDIGDIDSYDRANELFGS